MAARKVGGGGGLSSTALALRDLGLLLLFSGSHSTLAGEPMKRLMGLPRRSLERPFFVFQAAALLHLMMAHWQPFPGPVLWDVRGTALGKALTLLWAFGFAFLLSATFAIDHFDLFGLSQAFGADINRALGLSVKRADGLAVRAHYAVVAHPIMFGLLCTFWGTPLMTAPRLLLAVYCSLYVISATKLLEEPRLKAQLGEGYTSYLSTVPSFCRLSSMCPKAAPPPLAAAAPLCARRAAPVPPAGRKGTLQEAARPHSHRRTRETRRGRRQLRATSLRKKEVEGNDDP